MIECQHCKQINLVPGCPCRNFKVWNSDEPEEKAKTFISNFPRGAAERFVDRLDPEDGDEFELNVRDYMGRLFHVHIEAEVTVELTSTVRRVEEEATA
jgi:hypothetical protein